MDVGNMHKQHQISPSQRCHRVRVGRAKRTFLDGIFVQRLPLRKAFGIRDTPNDTRERFRIWQIELSIGAGEGIRTVDPDLGKVLLYRVGK